MKTVFSNKYHFDIFKIFSASLIGQVMGLLTIPIITRLYVPELYGEYVIYLQIVLACSIALTLRHEHLLLLFPSYAYALRALRAIMALAIPMLVGICIVGFLFSERIGSYYSLSLSNILILIVVAGFFTSFSYGLEQSLQKQERFFISSLGEIFLRFSFFIFAVAFSYMELDEYGLLISYFLSLSVKFFYLLWVSGFDTFKVRYKPDFKGLKSINKRALALVYSHSLLIFAQLVPLQYIADSFGKNSLGQFSLAFSTLNMVVLLGAQSMGKVYFQRMSAVNDILERRKLWSKTFKMSLLVAVPIYFIIYFASDWGYVFVFGDGWEQAGSFAKLLVFSSCLAFISRPMESTTLCLNIWWYSPLWHTFRVSAMFVLFFYMPVGSELEDVLTYYVSLLMFVYIIDIISQRALIEKAS